MSGPSNVSRWVAEACTTVLRYMAPLGFRVPTNVGPWVMIRGPKLINSVVGTVECLLRTCRAKPHQRFPYGRWQRFETLYCHILRTIHPSSFAGTIPLLPMSPVTGPYSTFSRPCCPYSTGIGSLNSSCVAEVRYWELRDVRLGA